MHVQRVHLRSGRGEQNTVREGSSAGERFMPVGRKETEPGGPEFWRRRGVWVRRPGKNRGAPVGTFSVRLGGVKQRKQQKASHLS